MGEFPLIYGVYTAESPSMKIRCWGEEICSFRLQFLYVFLFGIRLCSAYNKGTVIMYGGFNESEPGQSEGGRQRNGRPRPGLNHAPGNVDELDSVLLSKIIKCHHVTGE